MHPNVVISDSEVGKSESYTFEHPFDWSTAAISVAKNEERCRARFEILSRY
jgi:hypothetical protein